MKFQLWVLVVATVVGGAHSKAKWRGYGSPTPDYDIETTTFADYEDEFETVGSCTKTKLNVNVEEIDYAWCILDLAKYIQGISLERFLATKVYLQNTLEFDHPMLPGTWGFILKTATTNTNNYTAAGDNNMEVTIYYNTTDPDIVIQPELLLKAQKRAVWPCTQESNTIKRVEDVPYNTNSYDYHTFIRTTRPPARIFYSYQRKFRFYEGKLSSIFSSNPHSGKTLTGHSAGDLDLIFKITVAKKGSGAENTLTTSCEEPTYRVLQKQMMKDEKANFAPSNGSNAGGGGFGNGPPTWEAHGGFQDSLVPNRYSYSTPKYPYGHGYAKK